MSRLTPASRREATRRARAALALVRAGMGDHESGLRALTTLAELDRDAGDLSSAELLLEEVGRRSGTRGPDRRLAPGRRGAGPDAGRPGSDRAGHALLDEAEHPPSDGVRTKVALARARRAVLSAEGRPADGEAVLRSVIEALGPSRLAFVPALGGRDGRPETPSPWLPDFPLPVGWATMVG